MILNVILWLLFGALAGWIASMIMGTNAQQGAGGNIVTGILGAILGGFLFRFVFGVDISAFSLMGLIVSVIGAIILLAIVRAFTRRGATPAART